MSEEKTFLRRLSENKLVWFLLGAMCFYISQPLIRIPLLTAWQNSVGYLMLAATSPALLWLILGGTAGLAEELARFLFKLGLVRPTPSGISQPIIFGLGHGLMEVVYLLLPPLLSGYGPMMGLAFLERALAMCMHVGLTVMVWNGFQTGRRWLYLGLAILVHALIDSSLGLLMALKLTPLQTEGVIGLYALGLLIYTIYSRKYYRPSTPVTEMLTSQEG